MKLSTLLKHTYKGCINIFEENGEKSKFSQNVPYIIPYLKKYDVKYVFLDKAYFGASLSARVKNLVWDEFEAKDFSKEKEEYDKRFIKKVNIYSKSKKIKYIKFNSYNEKQSLFRWDYDVNGSCSLNSKNRRFSYEEEKRICKKYTKDQIIENYWKELWEDLVAYTVLHRHYTNLYYYEKGSVLDI